jgi:tRNA-modifying protein YgfZ
MLKPVDNAPRQTRLADMGVVRVQGADAVKFLQGQVSNDVARLSAQSSVLAGLHNPQGRAIAVLRLVLAGPEEILAIVPRELAGPVAGRLGKFVLRAKVKMADASSEWDVSGVGVGAIEGGSAAASVGAARRDEEGRLWVCVEAPTAPDAERSNTPGAEPSSTPGTGAQTSRWLVASRAAAHQAEPRGDEEIVALDVGGPMPPSLTRNEWHALDIAAGIPQVYAATSETFVAQMLNLDLVNGIAFDKGCYTGQEVIARAHYRGKVKRRMQRFRSLEPVKLTPGDTGTLTDGRSFKVVDAVGSDDGRSEFLAVTTFSSAHDTDDAVDTPRGTSSAQGGVLHAEPLPLPYSLPD